jgi:hypothetical protein
MKTSLPQAHRPKKKRGPLPQGYGDTHVLIDPDLIEWAKAQPQGLGATVRRLLRQERARQDRAKVLRP